VIGASAGGIEALGRLLAQLPRDFPAAVFVCQHIRADPEATLADILARSSALPLAWAEHGAPITAGRVAVARPGVHLLLGESTVELVAGPRENHARPSINRLFRSAATHHPGRAIGVLLTGLLDDGVSGLLAIKRCGGVSVIQDPADAAFPDLPRNARSAGEPDHVKRLDDMGPLLAQLVTEPPEIAPTAVPRDVAILASLDHTAFAGKEIETLGPQTRFSCPDCGGPMWDVEHDGASLFRCYLGHAESARSMLARKAEEIESSLWAAVRTIQERSSLLFDLAREARRGGRPLAAEEYEIRAKEAQTHAERARDFVLELQRAASVRGRG
jgi:two-component system chemotaxis response regulator CheB